MRLRTPSIALLKAAVGFVAVAAVSAVVAMPFIPMITFPAAWMGYGGNTQHTSISRYPAAGLGRVKWSIPIDEDIAAESSGSDVLIHYASPCITSLNPITGKGNTVVVAIHNNIGGSHDSWRIEGLSGSTGAVNWSYNTDYSAPVLMPSDWTSVYPLSITGTNSIAAGGGGGTVLVIPNADVTSVSPKRFCFYAPVSTYLASPSTYKNIKICTPITGDSRGNFFFGYTVTDPTGIPSSVITNIGTGGIVKFNTAGRYTYRSASSLISGTVRPPINCAPVISNDGQYVYCALRETATNRSYLAKLNALDPAVGVTTPSLQALALQASVLLLDPSSNTYARTVAESTASPLVGPDGHVFMGVFASNYRQSHGWFLEFDKNLSPFDSLGNPFPVGGFGWDDTPSIVPASAVPSYKGPSSYLILSKYNNYYGTGGNGRNHLAVLDPSNSYVMGATNATPIVVTAGAAHSLHDGQKVLVTGVTGNTNANGTFYAKVTGYSTSTFALYSDVALTVPVAGNAAYKAGGTFSGSIDRLSPAVKIMNEVLLVSGVSLDTSFSSSTYPPLLTVTNASNTSPVVVTTSVSHNLIDGQSVIVNNVGGTTTANGSLYAKVSGYSATTFGLYYDSALTLPVPGNGAYTSGGLVENALVPVREWCINAAAIDVANKCAIVNSEDGHAYKWDFVTNTLTQGLSLQPATGEAYTCTSVGPDGTSYAINNGVLHAMAPPTGP